MKNRKKCIECGKVGIWDKDICEKCVIEEMKREHMNEYIRQYRTESEKLRDYREKHPVIQFCGKPYLLKRHKRVPVGYVYHHTCYDHSDPEAYIVLMLRSDHIRAHEKMRRHGIEIPHINQRV